MIAPNRTQGTATYNRHQRLPYLCNTEGRISIPNNPVTIPNPHLTIKNQSTMKNTNKETLKTVLQFIVSVITALLATLGVQSCVAP